MTPNLKAQSKWGWLIAGYLFLAGVGGGAYITSAIADFLGQEWSLIARIGVCLGLPCVAVGCVFLLFDLGSPANFWRAAMRPNTSWMARGTIIISSFMVLNAIHIALWLWPFNVLAQASGVRQVIGVAGIVLALSTVVYTGILLGAARPIAFWSTSLLPLLFLVSALSTGIMAVILIAWLAGAGHAEPTRILARLDIALIILEMLVLAFYLQGTHRVPESRASAEAVLRGAVAPLFWWGVVVLGLLAPLLLDLGGVPVLASICGLGGGLILREVVLRGGIHAPLRAGRFEVALPIV